MPDAFPIRSPEPHVQTHKLFMVGTGASAPTELLGAGVAVTRTAAGRLLLTWAQNPGDFAGFTWGLNATTQGDVKGHTVTASVYPLTAGTYTLEVDIWDSAFAAEDLEALEWLKLDIDFINVF
jgi:hypothetical protein